MQVNDELKENLRSTFRESLLILVYEFMGTCLITTLFINTCQNYVDPFNGNNADLSSLLLGMFVIILFSARISGSHFNPIITFSYMIGNVREGKFDRILGVFYILAQFCGAAVGGLLSAIMMSGIEYHVQLSTDDSQMGSAILGETLGSFLMVFMYLCSTDDKTKLTKDKVIQTMILASAYLAAMLISGSNVQYLPLSPVNPAVAVFMTVTYNNSTEGWKAIWIFLLFGFVGSFAAFLFYRFIYKTTAETIEDIEEEEREQEEMAAAGDDMKKVLLEDA